MTELHRLHLDQFHADRSAKFSLFADYRMPIQYSLGVKDEHLHTRNAIGLFDFLHVGQPIVDGKEETEELDRLVPAAL